MIKPNALKKGDKIAIVSLSWGGLGDEKLIHKRSEEHTSELQSPS